MVVTAVKVVAAVKVVIAEDSSMVVFHIASVLKLRYMSWH